MEIRWDLDAVSGGLGCVKGALETLETCLTLSTAAREALIDARPTSDDQAVNKLIEKFDTTVRHLRTNDEAIEEIVRGLDQTILDFEGAEETVGGLIDRLFAGRQTDIPEAPGASPDASMGLSFEPWIPTPLILPDGMNRGRLVPDWLEPLLTAPSQMENWI